MEKEKKKGEEFLKTKKGRLHKMGTNVQWGISYGRGEKKKKVRKRKFQGNS